MMLSSFVTSIIPISCKAVMSSMGTLSGPAALPFFIFGDSSFKIEEPSIPLLIGGAGHSHHYIDLPCILTICLEFRFCPSGFVHP